MTKKIPKASIKLAKAVKPVIPELIQAEGSGKTYERSKKDKQVLGRFSIPRSDYDLLAKLKAKAKKNGHSVKKNELFGAGLQMLAALADEVLIEVLTQLKLARRRAKAAK